jgi:hypothetical protein
MRRGLSALLVLVLLGPASLPGAPPELDASSFSDCQRALHVLNRLGFGPAPGDVDRVLEVGMRNYIEVQLHPESLADPVVAARLDTLPTLRMAEADLMETFEKPLGNAQRVAEKEYGKPGEGNEEAAKAISRMVDELVPAPAPAAAGSG